MDARQARAFDDVLQRADKPIGEMVEHFWEQWPMRFGLTVNL